MRVRIAVLLDEPGRGVRDADAELLVELARERLVDGLARLELAARELPVARVGLARGAGTEKHLAVLANEHADGDINNLVAHN